MRLFSCYLGCMSESQFQVIYDGPALQASAMNVRELSASLAALDELFESADSLLNAGKTKQTLKVRGSFETGSFKVNFMSSRSSLDRVKDFLNSDEASAIIAAGDLVHLLLFGSLGVAGLIALTKFLRGQIPTKIHENEDGTFKVYRDSKFVKTERRTLELYSDYKTRKALEKTVQTPLEENKVTEIAFNIEGDPRYEVVTLAEREYFTAPDLDREDVNKMEYTAYISLIKVSFREGNKWSVYDGANTISVRVEDEKFLQGIEDNQVLFGKGDRLKVNMRVEQFEIDGALRTEYFIMEVLEHTHPEFKGQGDLI